MPLSLDRVHEYQRVPGTQDMRLIRTQPYVRITHGGDPPIFIQGGQFYYQGGTPVPALPEWLPDEIAHLSETVRAEVGLMETEGGQPQPKPKPPAAAVEQWTCPECGKSMARRGRTFHVLHHAKQAKKASAEP